MKHEQQAGLGREQQTELDQMQQAEELCWRRTETARLKNEWRANHSLKKNKKLMEEPKTRSWQPNENGTDSLDRWRGAE
jgi:hypothetical protein